MPAWTHSDGTTSGSGTRSRRRSQDRDGRIRTSYGAGYSGEARRTRRRRKPAIVFLFLRPHPGIASDAPAASPRGALWNRNATRPRSLSSRRTEPGPARQFLSKAARCKARAAFELSKEAVCGWSSAPGSSRSMRQRKAPHPASPEQPSAPSAPSAPTGYERNNHNSQIRCGSC